jgi:hypothetical protein
MLKAKTKIYPWKCFNCEKVYESNVEAAIIWDETGGERLHVCTECEDDTHIDDLECDICGKETQVVYTSDHDNYECDCGHYQELWEECDEEDDDETFEEK